MRDYDNIYCISILHSIIHDQNLSFSLCLYTNTNMGNLKGICNNACAEIS